MALLDAPRVALLAAVVLVAGIAFSIATTTDASWWRLYFSQLGIYDDLSAHAFNGAVIGTGALVCVFAARTRRSRVLHGRRSDAVIRGCIASMGVHLAVVGIVPVDTWVWLHDRAASGVTASFALALVVALSRARGRGCDGLARLTRCSAIGVAALAVTVPLFVAGIVNLTVLELVGFAAMISWLVEYGRAGAPRVAHVAAPAPARPSAERHSPRRRRARRVFGGVSGVVPGVSPAVASAGPAPSSPSARVSRRAARRSRAPSTRL